MDDAPKLADAEAAELTLEEREAAYEKFVWDNLPRNFAANFMHGMLGMTGFRIVVNTPTFIPVYLHMLASSAAAAFPPPLRLFANPDIVMGLGLALQQVGQVISPIFGASQIEHR